MRARGFTLIEVVLAATLFALLMSAYYVAFQNVFLLDEYARDERAFSTIGPAVLDLVEDDLLSLYTHPREPQAFPFRGENDSLASEPADRMNFVVRRASIHQEEFYGRDAWVRSPVNEVGYRLARGSRGGGSRLRKLYRRENYYVDELPLQGGDYYEIYDRVVAFDVTYAGYQVEEEARSSEEGASKANLDKFESWDSEERRGFPSAVIVSLTVEAPQLGFGSIERAEEERERRTFVRIIPLPQADDVAPPESGADTVDANPNPNANPGGPASPGR